MGRRLCSVDEHGDVLCVGGCDDVADGVDRAEHVAHVRHADEACTLREQAAVGVEVECAVVVHGDDAQVHSLALTEHLPGNDVAVVLHGRDDDFVACMAEGFAEREGQQVDAFGRAAGEDDLARRTGVDEAAHGFARLLVQFGGLLREEVDAAVYVGIHVVVFVADGFDHLARLLRRRGVVEIDERTAIDLTLKDGKIFSVHLHRAHPVHLFSSPRNRVSIRWCRRSRRGWRRTCSMTCPTKAFFSSSRASASEMPRCCM